VSDETLEHIDGYKTWIHKSHLIKEVKTYDVLEYLGDDAKFFDPKILERAQQEAAAFNTKKEEGDKIFYFDTGKASFAQLSGRAGYVILRDGKIVCSKVIKIS